jgi:hypothetical protein
MSNEGGVRLRPLMTSKLSRYLDGADSFPLWVLFWLTWADQVDTQTFYVLGPDIAREFHVGLAPALQ